MPKLLVVTPQGPNADELMGKLSEQGHVVVAASNGSEAFPTALRDPPDVILMDSALSAMDRWHAVKRLNAESRTSRIPVLTLASDAHSPAGLKRVTEKLTQTLGPARVQTAAMATPIAATSRVAARRNLAEAVDDAARTDMQPAGAVPPIRRFAADPAHEKVSRVHIGRREDPLDAGRILVVDDNDLNRDMLSRRLKRRGYTVDSAADGEQALAMVGRERFDLVLLDWMMPGLSGLDVLKQLRETRTGVELPVIMATAKTEADDIVQALRAGANDYVTKPLNFDVVHARIRTQLSLIRAHQDLLHSERRYRALVENTGDMIVQYDLEGVVGYVSPACITLLGFEPEEIQARGWYEGLHPIDRRELLSQQDPRSLPTNFTYIARMIRKDGPVIWVETSCRVMRNLDTGVVEMIQAACRDVSEHIDRIAGDEPPLPLGGDIMAHPGWRSHTGEPAPERGSAPPSTPPEHVPVPTKEPAPVPVVVVSAIDGLDVTVLNTLSNDEIGQHVARALRELVERNDA